MKSIYHFFASIKLTVVLLLALAVTSIVGTVIPQDWPPFQYQQHFGDLGYSLIKFFSLTDMYHSWWFQLLMSILVANLVVCTFKRLPKTLKIVRIKNPNVSSERIRKMRLHREVHSRRGIDDTWNVVKNTLRKRYPRIFEARTKDGRGLVAEKGHYSRFAVYVIHFSVLIVFAGALIGSFLGFSGFMNIDEGQKMSTVVLFGGQKMIELPFEVQCDKFSVSFYNTGQPKDFVSKLAVLNGNKVIKKKEIRVNDPLRFGGISFFQSNYGVHLKSAKLELTDSKTGETHTIELPYQQKVKMPGSDYGFQLIDYKENFSGFGPAIAVAIFQPGKEPNGSWLLVKFPNFHGNILGPYRVKVDSVESRYYTGLQVKKDPGVPVVWVGCTLLLTGIMLTFYTSHRRIWVRFEEKNPGTAVCIGGNCSKNRRGFKKEFDLLVEQLKADLAAEGGSKKG